MVIGIVAIGCGTAVVGHALDVAKAYVISRGKKTSEDPALHDALQQVREEMAQLRHASNDVVLSFDATLQRLDARLQHVEQRALGAATSAPPATVAREPGRNATGEEQNPVVAR
jgi:hypothetical protein